MCAGGPATVKLLASPKFSQFPGATQGWEGAGRMCGHITQWSRPLWMSGFSSLACPELPIFISIHTTLSGPQSHISVPSSDLSHKLQTLGPRTSQRMLHFPCAFHRLILSSTFKVAQESKHCTPLCGPCLVQPPRPPTHSLLMGLPASTPAPNRSPTGQTENCLKH